MIAKVGLFSLVNWLIISVELTASKLVLLLLVAIVVFKVYKFLFGYRVLDKFRIHHLEVSDSKLNVVRLLASLLSILLQHQTSFVHLTLIMVNIFVIALASYIPITTLFLVIVDLLILF